MVPAYRARKRASRGRTLWRLLWRAAAAAVLLVVAIVAALRVVDPPTTAFILGARLEARQAGEPLAVQQHWVELACLPDHLAVAVLAAEDQKFPTHQGFDVAQITDALEEARQGGRVRGASTLTQQTAKNLFLWGGQSWLRKGLEAGLTVLIELLWSKRRILEIYLNVAEFDRGIYGVEAAARHHFDAPAARLSAAQSALLAAVLPSPRRYSVAAPGDHVRERQRWILEQMPTVRRLPGVAGLLEQQDRCPPAA